MKEPEGSLPLSATNHLGNETIGSGNPGFSGLFVAVFSDLHTGPETPNPHMNCHSEFALNCAETGLHCARGTGDLLTSRQG